MGYIPFFLTFGAFILLVILVVNNTFKTRKEKLSKLSSQAFEVMAKIENKQTSPREEILLETVLNKYQIHKATLQKANPEIFEKELLPLIKSLKISKAAYNQLIAQKPYSFIAKLTGHQAFN